MSDINDLISYLREKSFIDETVGETIIKCHYSEINEEEFTEKISKLIAAVDRYKDDPKNREYWNDVVNELGYFEELAGNEEKLKEYGFIQPTTIVSLDDLQLQDPRLASEEEEIETKSLLLHPNNTPDPTPISTPLSVKNAHTINNIFLDNKTNMNSDSEDFGQSTIYDDDVNPFEDTQLEVSELGDYNKKAKK